jgi:hypothetical protein
VERSGAWGLGVGERKRGEERWAGGIQLGRTKDWAGGLTRQLRAKKREKGGERMVDRRRIFAVGKRKEKERG